MRRWRLGNGWYRYRSCCQNLALVDASSRSLSKDDGVSLGRSLDARGPKSVISHVSSREVMLARRSRRMRWCVRGAGRNQASKRARLCTQNVLLEYRTSIPSTYLYMTGRGNYLAQTPQRERETATHASRHVSNQPMTPTKHRLGSVLSGSQASHNDPSPLIHQLWPLMQETVLGGHAGV